MQINSISARNFELYYETRNKNNFVIFVIEFKKIAVVLSWYICEKSIFLINLS